MRFLAGALTGVILSTVTIGYIAVRTTTSYRSTLFAGQRVVIRNGKLEATPIKPVKPFKHSKPSTGERMVAEVRS